MLTAQPQEQSKPSTIRSIADAPRLGLSPEEFFIAIGIGRTAGYLALQRGEIPHRRIGRRIVIPMAAVERWLTGDDAA